MLMLLLQTIGLLLAAYFAGAFAGCLLRRMLARARGGRPAQVAVGVVSPGARDYRRVGPPEPRLDPAHRFSAGAEQVHRVVPPPPSAAIPPAADPVARPVPAAADASVERYKEALSSPGSTTTPTASPQPVPLIPGPRPVPIIAVPEAESAVKQDTALPEMIPTPSREAATAATTRPEYRLGPPMPVERPAPTPPARPAPVPMKNEPAPPGPRLAAAVVAAAAAATGRPQPAVPPTTSAGTGSAGSPSPQPLSPAEPMRPVPAAPVATGEAAMAAPIAPAVDDLTRIRGIDSATRARLDQLGIRRFVEIASWTAADVGGIGKGLGSKGRIERQNWIEQAAVLARGGETRFSREQLTAPPLSVPTGDGRGADGPATDTAEAVSPQSHRPPRHGPVAQPASTISARVEDRAVFAAPTATIARSAPAAAKPAPEAPRPTRLLDAIRETSSRSPAQAAGDDPRSEPVSAPPRPAPPYRPATQRSSSPVERQDRPPTAPVEESEGSPDDLKRIRGIGVLIERKLNAIGIHAYEQIANWGAADVDRVSQALGFHGRIERENWVEQARILSAGGQTEFSRRVDRGEVDVNRPKSS